jgi:hypothetical protein
MHILTLFRFFMGEELDERLVMIENATLFQEKPSLARHRREKQAVGNLEW